MSPTRKDLPEYSLGESEALRLHETERAFRSRPMVSIRLRIVAGFLLCFFLTGVTALVTLTILYQARGKLQFLRTSQDITFEVLQARRFEKDYFLFGTNLKTAKEHADRALALLQANTVNILDVAGEKNLAAMSRDLGQYDALLGQYIALEGAGVDQGRMKALEEELRGPGSRITDLAWTLNAKESAAADRMLTLSQAVPFAFLALLLLLIFWVAHLLAKTITKSLERFQGYTSRIAAGDFGPIQPAKPYRDEFSDMAMAVNRMLFELRAREAQVLQAGKLAAANWLLVGGFIVVALVAFAIFWTVENRVAEPLVATRYLRQRSTWALLLTTLLTMTGVFVARPRSIARVIFSPTTTPILPPMNSYSIAAAITATPSTVPEPTMIASFKPVVLRPVSRRNR